MGFDSPWSASTSLLPSINCLGDIFLLNKLALRANLKVSLVSWIIGFLHITNEIFANESDTGKVDTTYWEGLEASEQEVMMKAWYSKKQEQAI